MSALTQEAVLPKAAWWGVAGLPLSPAEIICWDQVGVTPAINTLGELLRQEGQQRDWAASDFFFDEFLSLSNRGLACQL